MRSDFYVYALCYPDGRPFYIGKGHGNRAWWHLRERSKNKHVVHTIRKIRRGGEEPLVELKRKDLIEAVAFAYERRFIIKYGRRDKKTGCLCNLTDGGEGTYNITDSHRRSIVESNRTRVVTQETKDRIGKALLGRRLTPERKALSGLKGEKHPCYGKKQTELTKRRSSRTKRLTRMLQEETGLEVSKRRYCSSCERSKKRIGKPLFIVEGKAICYNCITSK